MANLQESLIGTWKIVTYDVIITSAKGTTTTSPPSGPNPLGTITFTSEGYMSVLLTSSEASVPRKSSAWYEAANEDVVRAAKGMLAYCGQYHLTKNLEADLLVTKVDISLDPNWIGGDQVRNVEMKEEGGRTVMVLRPVEKFVMENGDTAEAVLAWEKILPK